MGSSQRRRLILKRVAEDGYAEVKSLAHELGVDGSTIRRDLLVLADQGRVIRTHGGALPVIEALTTVQDDAYLRPQRLSSIAAAAARHIRPGETVILDGGDAGLALAEEVARIDDVTVLTNDLQIVSTVSKSRGTRVVMTGGELFGAGSSLGGDRAVSSLEGVLADWAFVCADGIDPMAGVTVISSWHVSVKTAFIEHAQRSCVLVESSLFGRRALGRVCGLHRIHLAITDAELPDGVLPAYAGKVVRGAEGEPTNMSLMRPTTFSPRP